MTQEQRRAIEAGITRLIVLYASLNDLKRWADVAATYLEDGEMVRPSAPQQPLVGRAAILESFLARPPGRVTKHVCANVIVTVSSPSEAVAESTYVIHAGGREGDNPLPVLDTKPPTICEFHDRLTLTPEGWRFRSRRGVLLFRSA